MNVKIVHVTSVHNRFDTRIFHKECRSISKNGYSVSLLVADGIGEQVVNDVPIYDVGKFKNRWQRVFVGSKRILTKAKDLDADIIHVHDPELIPVALQLKKAGKKIVFDAHEDFPRQILNKHYIPRPLRRLVSKAFATFEARVCGAFDAIVAATPSIQKKYEKQGLRCVNVNNFPLLTEFKTEVNWKNKLNEACYLGGLCRTRGTYELIQATKYLEPKVKINICGEFFDETFKNLCIDLPEWKNVKNFGYVDRQKITEVLNRSFAGLVTLYPTSSYIDSLPVKMFEYMAAGIPVIASNFPTWREIIETKTCGLCVDPLQPTDIAKGIKFLFTNPKVARDLGNNGRLLIEREFNWEGEVGKLIKLYGMLETTLPKKKRHI
jgi:glycosyltransferase involved in cell wall biosynthesis